jgi:hypothetical protein
MSIETAWGIPELLIMDNGPSVGAISARIRNPSPEDECDEASHSERQEFNDLPGLGRHEGKRD